MGNAPELGIRVGDGERAQAVAALDVHLADGRLAPGEHEERSRRAYEARTRGELGALFDDLPAPRPALTTTPEQTERPATQGPATALFTVGIVVLVTGVPTAIVMTVLFGLWFLIPPTLTTATMLLVLSRAIKRR